MGWATIFLLLCTGVLEVAMNRLQTFQNKFTGKRMGPGGTMPLMKERVVRRAELYSRESRLLFLRMLGFWIFMTILVVTTTLEVPRDFEHPIVPYCIGCLGYVGLVFALFNKLYMGTKIIAAVKLIALSIFSGILVALVLIVVTSNSSMAAVATLVFGWTYGFGSYAYIHHQNETSVHKWGEDHTLLSPQILTSGQSWIGAKTAVSVMSHRAVLRKLERLTPDLRIGISCESQRGQRLLEKLRELRAHVGAGDLHPTLEECFGREGVVSILDRGLEALERNLASLYICPAKEMRGESGEGYSALAAMTPSTAGVHRFSVYVAVPWQHRNEIAVVDQLLCES